MCLARLDCYGMLLMPTIFQKTWWSTALWSLQRLETSTESAISLSFFIPSPMRWRKFLLWLFNWCPIENIIVWCWFRICTKWLSKTKQKGTPVNGYIMTGILVSILIIIPALGIGNMTELYRWLLNLNSVVMPLRYLWVFLVAFMLVNKHANRFTLIINSWKTPRLALGSAYGASCSRPCLPF